MEHLNFNKQLHLNFANYLVKCLPNFINGVVYRLNELSVIVNSNYINNVLFFFRKDSNCLYRVLTDATVVDYPEYDKRFEVVYMLLSLVYNTRIRVKTHINEITSLDSATNIYLCSNWIEREIWDMFGISFKDHPDLRRILTDYGFESYPLRKEFPLNGYNAVRYDDTLKIVLYENIELSQGYRSYDFQSSWSTINN
jgi:NADH/F420H2 dehydrogenase subunit C